LSGNSAGSGRGHHSGSHRGHSGGLHSWYNSGRCSGDCRRWYHRRHLGRLHRGDVGRHPSWGHGWLLSGHHGGLRVGATVLGVEGHSLVQRGGLGLDTQDPVAVEGRRGDRHVKGVRSSVLVRVVADRVPLHRIVRVVGAHVIRVCEERIRVAKVRDKTGAQPGGQLHRDVAQRVLAIHLDGE